MPLTGLARRWRVPRAVPFDGEPLNGPEEVLVLHELMAYIARRREEIGLTERQHRVLGALVGLAERGHAECQAYYLAQVLDIDQGALSKTLDALVAEGVVCQRYAPKPGRDKDVRIVGPRPDLVEAPRHDPGVTVLLDKVVEAGRRIEAARAKRRASVVSAGNDVPMTSL